MAKIHRPIIVLGMHRSGTSAISGALSGIGVFMGKDLFKAQKGVNEKGFFENSRLVSVNERMFKHLKSSWDNPLGSLVEIDLSDEEVVHEAKIAAKFLEDEYLHCNYWGMKDPRTTVLLPFWQHVFEILNIKPYYIIMIRHPAEVFLSLKKRDQFSLQKSVLVWLHYTFSAFDKFNEESYRVVSYDNLLNNTNSILESIINGFAPNLISELSLGKDFISATMRNNAQQDQLNILPPELLAITEKTFSLCTTNKIDIKAIQHEKQLYNEFVLSLLGPVSEHLEQVKQQELLYRKIFDDAYYSNWWKLAWPLRAIERIIKNK